MTTPPYPVLRLTLATQELRRLLDEKKKTPVSKRSGLLNEPTLEGLTSCFRHRGIDAAIGALAAEVRKILMESTDIPLDERNAIIVDCAERPLVQSEITLALAGESLARSGVGSPVYPCLIEWGDEESRGWIIVADDAERTAAEQCAEATDPDGYRWTPASYTAHWKRLPGAILACGGYANDRNEGAIVAGILEGSLLIDVDDPELLAMRLAPHSAVASIIVVALSGNPRRTPARPVPPLDDEG